MINEALITMTSTTESKQWSGIDPWSFYGSLKITTGSFMKMVKETPITPIETIPTTIPTIPTTYDPSLSVEKTYTYTYKPCVPRRVHKLSMPMPMPTLYQETQKPVVRSWRQIDTSILYPPYPSLSQEPKYSTDQDIIVTPSYELMRQMSLEELRAVDVSICHKKYGSISWNTPIDITGVDFGKAVTFSSSVIHVNTALAPSLNHPATMELYNILPKGEEMEYSNKLRRHCDKQNSTFISYEDGTWTFMVSSF